jgi:hypothetical protein
MLALTIADIEQVEADSLKIPLRVTGRGPTAVR